jgi:hypothetical protein
MNDSENPNNNSEPELPSTDNQVDNELLNTPDNTAQTEPVTNEPKKSKFKFPKIKLNRNTVLAASLALLLVIVGVFSLAMTRDNSKELNSEEVVSEQEEVKQLGASILIDEGSLEIVSKETGEWQDADTTTTIQQGTELRTVGASSRAVIGFDDGSALRLDANSEVVLEELTTERIVIKHVSGYTYSRVLPSDLLHTLLLLKMLNMKL